MQATGNLDGTGEHAKPPAAKVITTSWGEKEACQERTAMGQERRFPCPYCGSEFHYTSDEPRTSAPCLKCGKKLIMPHGSSTHVQNPVFGCHTGLRTSDEREKSIRKNAIWLIRRWEEVTANPNASREECRTAEMEAFWALWTLPAKSIVLDGKRYKGNSRAKGLSVSVTPAPEKKQQRGSSGSVDGWQ